MRTLVALLAVVALVVGCSTKKPVVPADQLWKQANEYYDSEAWELAIERYKSLLDQHPFDENAEEAERRIAYSYYMAHRYPEAIAAFGDFERMHPTSEHLPFIEYHLGLSYLSQATTADRDQQSANNANTYFRNLIDRFPTSPWAERARLRMRETREMLAGHESGIALYYVRHRNISAAETRLGMLLREYPETNATAELLDAFATIYDKRDEPDGARLARATLIQQHPEGPLAIEARTKLGPDGAPQGDALPMLLAHLDAMRAKADRKDLPRTVSAYPDNGAAQTPGQY